MGHGAQGIERLCFALLEDRFATYYRFQYYVISLRLGVISVGAAFQPR